tara:strand:- start:909 stop:2432 length:1524 start_codon:yes stop_codon:yes gene_type:complete
MRLLFCIFIGAFIWFMLSLFSSSVGLTEDNDTAFSTNILPNAGTTTSNFSNAQLDGVASSTTSLTNNSTHNGFTVTCETQVSNACGQANSSVGEIEASHDLTITANGSLVGINGTSTPDGVSHTSTQQKLNGGINLTSSIAVQNCEWSGSAYKCGSSAGAVDSYTITMKVLDSNDNVLATSTQIRTTDSGYNANERVWDDNLHYNGVHANKYEWSWTGVDGSGSTTSALRGTNLLGAEMALDFPTDDYEPLSTAEIKSINESLGTTNLTESEIWNVVSGLEESISEKLNLETNGAVVSVELNEETMSVTVYTAKEATVKEVAKVQAVVQTMSKTKAVETMKKEVIEEVVKESRQEEPKETIKEEKTVVTSKSKQETNKQVKQETKTISKKETATKENVKPELKVIMAKVDAKIKNPSKNLELKNLIKMDRMTESDISLIAYNNTEFYIPKDIYLNQIEIFDNRAIYKNIDLVKYTANDIMDIKIQKLNEIKYKKNILRLEIMELKNG